MYQDEIHYHMGPTAARFHADNSRIRALRGPIRTGKSVTSCVEVLRRAMAMEPCSDGVRRSRALVIRNTYGQLKDTTIRTFLEWIPPETYGDRRGFREHPHPGYNIRIPGKKRPDGRPVELEVWFRALDRPDHVRNLLSMEYTFWFANEARELRKEFIDWLDSRSGQYPPKIRKPDDHKGPWPSWYGGWMDTNSPDEDHWWYELFEEQCNPDHEKYDPRIANKFKQFFVTKEENEANLPENYYEELSIGKSAEWIKIYVEGGYGLLVEGKAVYPEYSDPYHCRETDYNPVEGLEICRGFDLGDTLYPAVVFSQVNQGLEVFDEFVLKDCGVHKFKDYVVEYCAKWYPGATFRDYGDPAMMSRLPGDKEEQTTHQIMSAEPHPIKIMPGHVAFTGRREAVNKLLLRVAAPHNNEPAQPYFRLSPRCRMLRTGFKGMYQYPEIGTNTGRYHDKPVKNEYSHPHDALQYLVTGIYSHYEDKDPETEKKKKHVPSRPPSAMAA